MQNAHHGSSVSKTTPTPPHLRYRSGRGLLDGKLKIVKKNWVSLILFLSPLLFAMLVNGDSLAKIYYVRFDVKSTSNRIERSNLMMVQAEEEYRMESFTSFRISGSADDRVPVKNGMTTKTQAEHNAIKHFLETHGLKSVKSRSTVHNYSAHGEMVLSFEGAIMLPYRRIRGTFDPDTRLYTATIEIYFAPFAFPDEWQKKQFKYQIRTLFNDILSIF